MARSCARLAYRRGFTLVEAVTAVGIVALLFLVLVPMAGRVRNADGLQVSIANVAQIVMATQAYYMDHAGQVPMRGTQYTNGLMNGWDSWNYGGKNCDIYWTSSGIFDEPAHSRFLNPYLYSGRIVRPAGYVNTGSGSTWTFNHGVPSAADRLSFQIPVFRSPGDVATRQRTYPLQTPGISGYDDVGTSYMLNMEWWDLPGLPLNFTAKYDHGVKLIRAAFGGSNPNYVWIHDQTANAVTISGNPQVPGEFGEINASVVGFADGRATYLQLVPGAMSGPGYTFAP